MTYRCSLWGGSLAPLKVGFWATYDRIRKRKAQRFPAALPTLRSVAPGLWCGGKPDKHGLEQLQRRGIRRVIDLCTEREQLQHAAKQCQALGIEHVAFPMGESLPDFPQLVRLLECLDEAPHRPTYIHCREGKNRVGSVVVLYRVTRQGWSLERAGAELLRNGFDTSLRYLAQDTAFYAAALSRPGLRHSLNRESKPALNPALTALLVLGLTTIALPAQAHFSLNDLWSLTVAVCPPI